MMQCPDGRSEANDGADNLEQLRARLKCFVRRRLDSRISARVDASDIVQEVFAQTSRRASESNREPPYWRLKQIAYERAIDSCRKHLNAQRRSVLRELSAEMPWGDESGCTIRDILASDGSSPDEKALRDEKLRRVREALQRLPASDRELLTLRHLGQRSVEEIADLFHTSRSVITTRHLRAIKRLRRLLNVAEIE